MLNRFPIYIPSKGRWDIRLTSNALIDCGLPHTLVIEEEQYQNYKEATADNPFVTLLILDKNYQINYDTCDNLGLSKSVGPGAARNFIWDHSIEQGFDWHWTMDDNIRAFYRLYKNRKIIIEGGLAFRAMEDFCLRYENLYMAGPNYKMFVPAIEKRPIMNLNTRVYSCNLIRNDIPYRLRGRYNEDTDLSLRILKDGYCTVQFNAFLQDKITTQLVKGGNTAEFYSKEGTYPKSEMQVRLHPDVSRLVHKFGRIHHHVDYRPFRKNKLKRKPNYDEIVAQQMKEANNYEMVLVNTGGET